MNNNKNTVNTAYGLFDDEFDKKENNQKSVKVETNKKIKEKRLPVINNLGDIKIKVCVTKNVLHKIEYLCKKFPNNEWSGACFYSSHIDTDENKVILMVNDIFPEDFGDKAYTEFKLSSEHAAYMARHIELLDGFAGLIHSHNTFDAFFSPTDVDTLIEMAPEYKMFLSLVVNNAGKIIGMVTIHGLVENNIKYTGFDYKEHSILNKEEVVLKYIVEIVKENDIVIEDEFVEIVRDLETNKNKHSSERRKIDNENKSIELPEITNTEIAYDKETENKKIEVGYEKVTEFLCAVISQNYFYQLPLNAVSNFSEINKCIECIPDISLDDYERLINLSIDEILTLKGFDEYFWSGVLTQAVDILKSYIKNQSIGARRDEYSTLYNLCSTIIKCLEDYTKDIYDEEEDNTFEIGPSEDLPI